MKSILIFCLLAVSVHLSQQQCNSTNCKEPSCRCASTTQPGGLTVAQTPQIVILSFDGAITKAGITNYTSLINRGLLNPNGCPISMTFFINHENNDYNLTNYLYNKRQEIATHSISHTTPSTDWGIKDTSAWRSEIGGMTYTASTYGNVPKATIRGQKCPFLQCNGDATFAAMKAKGVEYDCSFPVNLKEGATVPIWPYTMDFGLQHECLTPPCPKGSFPGIWTFPMVSLKNKNGTDCANVECNQPTSQQETFDFLRTNFERHFTTNRAPFIVSQTATAWFASAPYIYDGYIQFLNYLNAKDEVYIVSMAKALDWLKNPVSLNTAGIPGGPFSCPTVSVASCPVRNCLYDDETGEQSASGLRGSGRMVSCSTCPERYPWVCNPGGKQPKPSVCEEGF